MIERALFLLLAAGCGGKAIVDGGAGGAGSAGSSMSTAGGAGMAQVSSSGFTSSGTGQSCAEIGKAYRAAFQGSLACNPAISAEQCQQRVDPDLEKCCDEAWVNIFDKKDIAAMGDLRNSFKAAGCVDPCQTVDCPPPIPTVGLCDAVLKACRTIQLKPPQP